MNGGADLRYSDRDVRDNPGVTARVVEYLENYTGEFDYLIDCKMRLANGDTLTVGMVRGVLNCMRNDPRVIGLPAPQPPDQDVIDLDDRRSPRRRSDRRVCTRTDPHPRHGSYADREVQPCAGIYLINRKFDWGMPTYKLELKPEVLYVAAKSQASLVHKVAPEGHKVQYFPHEHEWGWWKSPIQHIVPACEMPKKIKNPYLLTQEWFDLMQGDEELSRARCGRCFDI